MPCSNCGTSKILARGLCQPCYWRLRRNGTVDRKYVINSGSCAVEGCEKAAFAKNLCQTHYNRADHPLKATWKLLRSRNPGDYPENWDRFENFLTDVGPRPSAKHQLRRLNAAKPFSKENATWLAPVKTDYTPNTWPQEKQAEYARAWSLKKSFGITVAQYDELLALQNGACAICGNRESHIHKSGKLKELSVDHCHTNGNVRGLLCMNCNQALGRFQDNIENLRRAIVYLEKSKA